MKIVARKTLSPKKFYKNTPFTGIRLKPQTQNLTRQLSSRGRQRATFLTLQIRAKVYDKKTSSS